MRRKVGILCITLGVLLIVSAAVLVICNQIEASGAANASEDILPKVMQEIAEYPTQTVTESEEDLLSAEMTVVEIDGYEYIGYLSVPALNLELPVMSEWDYSRLKVAPCRYYGSVYTDNFVIAGHNYAGHFGRLSELSIGDVVRFTTMDGETYTYRVGDFETLSPNETEKMVISDWDLSLYTCTPGGEKRVTVRCERKSASD